MNLNEQYYTLSEIREQILLVYDGSTNDTNLVLNIDNFLRDHIASMQHESGYRWGASVEKRYKILLEDGKREYPLPPHYSKHLEARWYDSDSSDSPIKILYLPFLDFNFKYAEDDEGSPEFFTIIGESIRFGPTPSESGNWIELDYAKTADLPSSDTDYVLVPAQYVRPLKLRVQADINRYQSKADVGELLDARSDRVYNNTFGIDAQRHNEGGSSMQYDTPRYSGFRRRK